MAEANNEAIRNYLRDLASLINEIESNSNAEMVKAGLALIDKAPQNLRTMLRLKTTEVRG